MRYEHVVSPVKTERRTENDESSRYCVAERPGFSYSLEGPTANDVPVFVTVSAVKTSGVRNVKHEC